MLNALNQRIMQTKEQIRTKRKLQAMLSQVEQARRQMRLDGMRFREQLAAEKADVDKLESISLTGLFYAVLGTKSEHLDKEKKEYLAAQLKFDENRQAIEEAKRECDRLRSELDSLQEADRQYEQLLEEKETLLAESNNPRAVRLLGLSERLTDLTSDQKELCEAMQAGERALQSLEAVRADLESATNWGTFDIVGGGMLATMAKHSKIDAAKQHAHDAQQYLRKFQQELADAGSRLNVSLDMDGFSKFADFFFDGLIADWVVQSKIREASSACSSTTAQVASAVGACRRRLAETEKEIEATSRERCELIENTG